MSTHDSYTNRLSDYLDDELSPHERSDVETHLRVCTDCRTALAELREVTNRAVHLPDAAPAGDLWSGIAQRIGARSGVIAFRGVRRFTFTLPQLVAASLALMVLSGGMVWLARVGGERTDFPGLAAVVNAPVEPPAPAISLSNFADAHFDDAIADLQQTLDAGRARLDPETVRVLEANLASIDRAIDQCRRALAADPANAYLNGHLAEAKRRKLALLRRATALTGS